MQAIVLLMVLVPGCMGVRADARVFVPVEGDTPHRVQIPIPQDQAAARQNLYGVRYGVPAYPPPPPYQTPAPIQEEQGGEVEVNNGGAAGGGGFIPSSFYRYPPSLQEDPNREVESNGINGGQSGVYGYQQVPIRVSVGGGGSPSPLYRFQPQGPISVNVAAGGSPPGLYGYPQPPPHHPVGLAAGNGYGHNVNNYPIVSVPVDQSKPFGVNGLTYGTHLYPTHRLPAPIYEDMGPDIPPNGANGVGVGLRNGPVQAGLGGVQYGTGTQPVVSTAQAVVQTGQGQSSVSPGQLDVSAFSVASPGQLKAAAQSQLSSVQQGLRLADLNKLRLSGSAGLGQLGTLGVEELSQVLGSQGFSGPHMNPVFATLLMGSLIPSPALGIGHNHFRTQHHHLQGLLLKHYGKYLPYGLGSYGLYGYSASNNVHNSNSFGRYNYENRI